MSWGQECVAIMQKSPKETYLIKKEKLLISKNLAIRETKAFDLNEKLLICKNLVIRKKKSF